MNSGSSSATALLSFERTERLLLASKAADEDEIWVRLQRDSVGSSRHPLLSTEQQLLIAHGIRHLHVQIASRASDSFPELPLPLPQAPSGPAGILVAAEFVILDDDEQDARLRQRFVALLDQLTTMGGILTAPLGRSSMENHRLHRRVHVKFHDNFNNNNSTSSAATVSTLLTTEGAHTAFSTEGLRRFLPGDGVFAVTDSAAWSHWFLGGGPESLDEARRPGTDPTAADAASRPNHRRRSLWMDWSATGDRCFVVDATNDDSCQFRTQNGLQYAVDHPTTTATYFAIRDVLPASSSSWLPVDPWADETVLELWGMEWATSYGVKNAATLGNSKIKDDPRRIVLAHGASQLNLSEPSLTTTSGTRTSTGTVTTDSETADRRTSESPFWTVQSHLWRVAAHRGTWEVRLENRHTRCEARLQSLQWDLYALEPLWRSLTVRVVPIMTTAAESHSDELLEHGVQLSFRDDDSVQLSLSRPVSLPPQSALEIAFDYEPSFLSIDDFPGDANRGFELPPVRANVGVELDGVHDECDRLLRQMLETTTSGSTGASMFDGGSGGGVDLYSNSLLLVAPLPDASMPFNVISLTCTLFAFVVGSLINLLVSKGRQPVKEALEGKKKGETGRLGRLKQRMLRVKEKLRIRFARNKPPVAAAVAPDNTADSDES